MVRGEKSRFFAELDGFVVLGVRRDPKLEATKKDAMSSVHAEEVTLYIHRVQVGQGRAN